MGDALAAEEDVLVGDVAGGIGFVEDFGARAVPIDFAAGFLDAIAVAIVGVVNTGGGFDFAFGIPGVGIVGVVQDIAGSVVAKASDLVRVLADNAETFLRAAVVSGGGHVDVGQVAKLAGGGGGIVVDVGFTPAV